MEHTSLISLDVGEKRIGVAHADTSIRVAVPYGVVDVDGMEFDRLKEIISEYNPSTIIVGLPRNQAGAMTQQTENVRFFARNLEQFGIEVVFQDESVTSILAEDYLKSLKKPYTKGDVDAHAAAIILGDYLEEKFGTA